MDPGPIYVAVATVLAVGIPSTISALSSRRQFVGAADKAQTEAAAARAAAVEAAALAAVAAETLGVKNGNGDAMTMLAKSLGNDAELFMVVRRIMDWQNQHESIDLKLVELGEYTHAGIHALRNQLTPLKGRIDVLWDALGMDDG